MIHWQPTFERTKPNICIAMHIALEQGHSQIRSGDVGACKSNDKGNAHAFILSVFLGIQHILPRFGRFKRALARKNHVHARCRLSSRTHASWSRGKKAATSGESACGAKSTSCESKKKNCERMNLIVKIFFAGNLP